MMTLRTILVLSFLALAGCAGLSAEGTARTAAHQDLSCSAHDIDVTNVGGSTYHASGCGQAATYECRDDAGPLRCIRQD